MNKVRVRFAPSPTGPLHLGGVRTALYDYLFAKNQGGDFILRIEDTDTARFVEGAEDYIMDALEWCGISPTESPRHGGAYGPYRQSERREIYAKYQEQILKTESAYLAFDTPEELDALRATYEKKGNVFSYNFESRNQLKNSLTLSKEEVLQLLNDKVPYVVRFKMPVDRLMSMQDMIRGHFNVNTNTLDDKVLVKNDGMPTYHFANVIDDFEMKISHVIRGEEWLPSMALHMLLYETFGWKAPQFAHLSLILKPEGKGKLSKRDGDKFGFPVFPMAFKDPETQILSMGYKQEGFLPQAFINMLALLGWSPANNQELMTLKEMTQLFDLNKVHKAGARFSFEKAKWFNQNYLHQLSDADFLQQLKPQFQTEIEAVGEKKMLVLIQLLKERCVFAKDIFTEGDFFFTPPTCFDQKASKKAWNEQTSVFLPQLMEDLAQEDFTTETISVVLHQFAEKNEMGMGKLMMPLRLALVGSLKGPDVPVIMEFLGKNESLARINFAINDFAK